MGCHDVTSARAEHRDAPSVRRVTEALRSDVTHRWLVLGCLALASGAAHAESTRDPDGAPPIQVRVGAEAGFFATLRNFGAFGTDASRIDFRTAAGQDNLLPYTRWSVELDVARHHTFVLLYQPLASAGTSVPASDVRYADVTFAANTPVHTEFNFPFYRLSYLYRLVDTPCADFQLGATGQIRNANYTYEQAGLRFARNASVGFVPALKLRASYRFANGFYLAGEADGIYAPISVFNGSTNDTVGAILDASVRVGYKVSARTRAFFNVRYLGGGATNTDPNDYAKNWLHFMFFGVGADYDLVAPSR